MMKNYTFKNLKKKIDFAKNKLCVAALVALSVQGIDLNAQVTYSFTPGAATGRFGPTQAQVNAAYLATNLNGSVVSTAGIQTFTIPTTGSYDIDAYGAQGGSQGNIGGLGARMKGTFTLTAGTVLKIIVGQKGLDSQDYNVGGVNDGGGGGGGSFVADITNSIMVVAGGGGGRTDGYNPGTNVDAAITTTGQSTNGNGGGVSGNGGNNGISDGPAAGGGGFNTDGVSNGTSTGGLSFLNGGNGGTSLGGGQNGGDGGFGGGGGGWHNSLCRSGGGGGYSGGQGGRWTNPTPTLQGSGGGGASINNGFNQVNVQSSNSGNGKVIISLLCNPGALPTNTTLAANQNICANNTTTLTVNGTPTLSWYATNVSTVVLGTGSVFVTPTLAVGVYTYYAASTNTCAQGPRAPITVTVNASPSVAVAGPTAAVCAGSSVSLTASGAATYSWNNGAVTATIAPTPTANASYTVIGTSSVGCSASAVIAVSVTALPSVSITGAGTICIGNSTVLTASGANTYSWNTGATTSSISISPTVNTTYTAMGTSSVTGCTGIISANIVVSPCTGVSTVSSKIEGLSIYPNPSLGDFTVELNNGLNKTIQVIDVTGKVVLTGNSSKDKTNINITHLSSGIYFVKIQSNNAVEVIKVVKQ